MSDLVLDRNVHAHKYHSVAASFSKFCSAAKEQCDTSETGLPAGVTRKVSLSKKVSLFNSSLLFQFATFQQWWSQEPSSQANPPIGLPARASFHGARRQDFSVRRCLRSNCKVRTDLWRLSYRQLIESISSLQPESHWKASVPSHVGEDMSTPESGFPIRFQRNHLLLKPTSNHQDAASA